MKISIRKPVFSFVAFAFVLYMAAFLFPRTSVAETTGTMPTFQLVLPDPFIKSWASQAVTEIFNFSHVDFRERLEAGAEYFNDTGWKNFLQALDDAKILEYVIQNNKAVMTVLTAEPVIAEQGVGEDGIHRWTVIIPVETTYIGKSEMNTIDMHITLTIVRSDLRDNTSGIAIQQWLAEARR